MARGRSAVRTTRTARHAGSAGREESRMARFTGYRRASLVVSACLMAVSGPARADSVEDFYRGKTIQFVIRAAAGAGGYDAYARLLGRFIGRHIPGHPQVLPVNMPGGGGIVAANYVARVAPK